MDGDNVYIVNAKTGKRGYVPRAELDKWGKAGYAPESAEATERVRLDEEYGGVGQTIIGGAEALLRGGTAGLSDVVLAPLDAEGVRERRAQSPVLNTALEVVGGIAGSALPLAPAGMVTKAGAAVERGAAEYLGKGAASAAVKRYAPTLVRNSTEGVLFGTGNGISNVALSKEPMSAESIVGEIGSEAMLGGGIGAGLGVGGQALSDSASYARAYTKRLTTPTIADEVIAIGKPVAGAAAKSDDVLERIGQRPPRQSGETRAALETERDALKAERVVEELSGGVDNVVRQPDEVIEKFKADYHRQDTVGRQQIRQMESFEKRGIPVTPELQQAAADLEASRRAMRQFMPLEPERSYDSILDGGNLGGSYAKGQGKSLQTWTGDNKAIAEAVRKEGFRDAVAANQEAIDHMQGLLGNKAYPPVIGDHPVFSLGEIEAQAATKTKALEEIDAKLTRLEKVLSSDASAAVKQKHFDETVQLAESRGMTVTEQQLDARIKDAGFDIDAKMLPKEELNRLKADMYRQMAKDEIALTRTQAREQIAAAKKAKAKQAKEKTTAQKAGGLIEQLMGDSVGEKVATGIGATLGSAIGVGPYVGGLAGRAILGNPLRKITEAMSGKAGESMQKLAAGVDAFLGGAGKVAKMAPRGTMGVLNAVSYRTDDHDKEAKGTAFEKRAAELSKAAADPMHTRQQIHDSLSGVRMADPMLADQMEELAFNRIMFLSDKLPKTPIIGSAVGKRKDVQPTDSEIAKFARYVDAAENPIHVVDDLRHGTVTLEQAEVLEVLYPSMYSAIRGDIASRAAELQSELPWDKRLSMSVLFKTPADSIMRPASIATMQANFIPPEPDKPPPQGSMPSVKPPQVTSAQRMASGG